MKIRVTITNAIVNNGSTLDAFAFVADTGGLGDQDRGSSYRAVRRLFFEPGGRPGPRRRRRRRPFFGGFVGERLPNRLAIALRTSVCTSSRITVMMLLRRGIPHLPATDACPI